MWQGKNDTLDSHCSTAGSVSNNSIASHRPIPLNLQAASLQAAQLVEGLLGPCPGGHLQSGSSDVFPESESDISLASSRAPPRTSATVHGIAPSAAAGARRQLLPDGPRRHELDSPSRSSSHATVTNSRTFSPGTREERSKPYAMIQQMQMDHEKRLNEMAEANARIARLKEAEIQELTATMKRELEKASLRESLALRRAEEVEREHKQDMLQLRAQLEHLQKRLEGRTAAERQELAGRLQEALASVRAAAEKDLEALACERDEAHRERDEARAEREVAVRESEGLQLAIRDLQRQLQEMQRWHEAALEAEREEEVVRAQLEATEDRLILARDDMTHLTVARTQEVSEIKAKLEALMRMSAIRQEQGEEEHGRLRRELEEQHGTLKLEREAFHHRYERLRASFEKERKQVDEQHAAQIEVLQDNKRELQRRLEALQAQLEKLVDAHELHVHHRDKEHQQSAAAAAQQTTDNGRLLDLVSQLQHERALALAEIRSLKSHSEFLARENARLGKEVKRLDKFIYGRKGGGSASSSSDALKALSVTVKSTGHADESIWRP